MGLYSLDKPNEIFIKLKELFVNIEITSVTEINCVLKIFLLTFLLYTTMIIFMYTFEFIVHGEVEIFTNFIVKGEGGITFIKNKIIFIKHLTIKTYACIIKEIELIMNIGLCRNDLIYLPFDLNK